MTPDLQVDAVHFVLWWITRNFLSSIINVYAILTLKLLLMRQTATKFYMKVLSETETKKLEMLPQSAHQTKIPPT